MIASLISIYNNPVTDFQQFVKGMNCTLVLTEENGVTKYTGKVSQLDYFDNLVELTFHNATFCFKFDPRNKAMQFFQHNGN